MAQGYELYKKSKNSAIFGNHFGVELSANILPTSTDRSAPIHCDPFSSLPRIRHPTFPSRPDQFATSWPSYQPCPFINGCTCLPSLASSTAPMPAIFYNIAGSTYYLGIQPWDRIVLNRASFRACPGSPLSQQNQQHVPKHALLGARVQKIKITKSGITLTPAQSQAPGLIHSSHRLANL